MYIFRRARKSRPCRRCCSLRIAIYICSTIELIYSAVVMYILTALVIPPTVPVLDGIPTDPPPGADGYDFYNASEVIMRKRMHYLAWVKDFFHIFNYWLWIPMYIPFFIHAAMLIHKVRIKVHHTELQRCLHLGAWDPAFFAFVLICHACLYALLDYGIPEELIIFAIISMFVRPYTLWILATHIKDLQEQEAKEQNIYVRPGSYYDPANQYRDDDPELHYYGIDFKFAQRNKPHAHSEDRIHATLVKWQL